MHVCIGKLPMELDSFRCWPCQTPFLFGHKINEQLSRLSYLRRSSASARPVHELTAKAHALGLPDLELALTHIHTLDKQTRASNTRAQVGERDRKSGRAPSVDLAMAGPGASVLQFVARSPVTRHQNARPVGRGVLSVEPPS